MIIATPLDFPKIEPDSWNDFMEIWNSNSEFLIKTKKSINRSKTNAGDGTTAWKGIDIHTSVGIDPDWKCPFVDIKNTLPNMYKNILNLPFKKCLVRIIQSQINIPAHADNYTDVWNIRAILKCDDPNPQWYFTSPHPNSEKHFLKLPQETNWFTYNDKYCWHGSIYNSLYPKYLIQIYTYENVHDIRKKSIDKYKDYTISIYEN